LKLRRHSFITAMKRSTSIDSSRDRLAGLLAISSAKCSVRQTASMPSRCAVSMN
jgi:hypothetical protein